VAAPAGAPLAVSDGALHGAAAGGAVAALDGAAVGALDGARVAARPEPWLSHGPAPIDRWLAQLGLDDARPDGQEPDGHRRPSWHSRAEPIDVTGPLPNIDN
jgi:hypothetical protein